MPVHAAPVWARLFRWLGALLFLGSFGYFPLSYKTTFGAPAAGTAAAGAVAWNVTLFTLFALHHSVCARTSVRLWISRRVYVLIAIPLEERSMRSGASNAYGGYEAQVRWRLVPGVY